MLVIVTAGRRFPLGESATRQRPQSRSANKEKRNLRRSWSPLCRDLRGLLLRVEPAHFGAIATGLHVAPATAMIFAGVEKEPLAGGRRAGAHQCQIVRRE